MKKVIMSMFLLALLIVATPVHAEEQKKVTIYMFRSNECAHCEEGLEYIHKHKQELGEYIELKTYEVNDNATNKRLQTKVEEALGVPEEDAKLDKNKRKAGNVPLFVIGSYYTYGYGGDYSFNNLLSHANDYVNNLKDYEDIVGKVLQEENIDAEMMTIEDIFPEASKLANIIVFSVFGLIIVGFLGMIFFSRK